MGSSSQGFYSIINNTQNYLTQQLHICNENQRHCQYVKAQCNRSKLKMPLKLKTGVQSARTQSTELSPLICFIKASHMHNWQQTKRQTLSFHKAPPLHYVEWGLIQEDSLPLQAQRTDRCHTVAKMNTVIHNLCNFAFHIFFVLKNLHTLKPMYTRIFEHLQLLNLDCLRKV